MKWIMAILTVVCLQQYALAQDKKIDQLEILYDQAYYRKVLRQSNKMLADPEFDYSGLPSYYKSLALFRLADEPKWFKRHEKAIPEAIEAYKVFAEHGSYEDYVHAHYYELAAFKHFLNGFGKKMSDLGYKENADLVFDFKMEYLLNIKAKSESQKPDENDPLVNTDNVSNSQRDQIVAYAKTLIGIKYVWAGSDEKGFDCSGFTSYVMKKYGILLSRTASGQMAEAKKVKVGSADKADLVFFGPGANITHVGMVVSEKGKPLTMIHASTSKGVIITNVEESTYWKPKLKSAGSYLS
ncbi:C40 family peptidase [Paracrocinitomix mangrovi]|uniref:C40 family peptidase n=1 Tax=Paracrocinitomix mangrovi TaxID=2862509 RepID=UPI001C8F0139|nr:C40 family peptidase [Paracrocinitomix mangrovi]UKN01331.1 C40 family peptidase [Paracrocinitomix mangrovi]